MEGGEEETTQSSGMSEVEERTTEDTGEGQEKPELQGEPSAVSLLAARP